MAKAAVTACTSTHVGKRTATPATHRDTTHCRANTSARGKSPTVCIRASRCRLDCPAETDGELQPASPPATHHTACAAQCRPPDPMRRAACTLHANSHVNLDVACANPIVNAESAASRCETCGDSYCAVAACRHRCNHCRGLLHATCSLSPSNTCHMHFDTHLRRLAASAHREEMGATGQILLLLLLLPGVFAGALLEQVVAPVDVEDTILH